MDEIKRILPDEVFSEAAGVLEVVAMTPRQKRIYDSRLKFQRDDAARNKFAREEALREGREDGRKEGREDGRKEGLEDGRKEGREDGRREGLEDGRKEGLEQGREVGVLLGRIATLQELIGINEPTIEELSKYDSEQLSAMVSNLRDQLRSRSPL
jgi:flagellar biosynthesis/type III secretory pathway protein FliH